MMRRILARLALPLLLAGTLVGSVSATNKPKDDYLFVWARDADGQSSDFLAVIDVGKRSRDRNKVIATALVGQSGTFAHHTEHEMATDGLLFANGFGAGRTWLFDLADPRHPTVRAHFDGAGALSHAHSFASLPNGNRLATFQETGHGNRAPGGLAEISTDGKVIRTAAAAVADPDEFIRPYSLVTVPALDRVVSTTSDMHAAGVARTVQIWRLSDLALLHTIRLPAGPRGKEGFDPAEPRVLADGRTVLVSTFECGLYRLTGLEGASPAAELVHDFGTGACALPVVAGKYWVMANNALPGLLVLDVSNPARPRRVSELTLTQGWSPHWLSLAPDRKRIVVTGYEGMESKLFIVTLNPANGRLSLTDQIEFDRIDWPHGATGRAIPHGAVFSR